MWGKVGWVGGRFKREGRIYVYLWLIHTVVWLKPTQHCKAIILHFNKRTGARLPTVASPFYHLLTLQPRASYFIFQFLSFFKMGITLVVVLVK